MSKFIFTYHLPAGYVPGSDPRATEAWQGFFDGMFDHVVDPGLPVISRSTLGELGTSTQLGGYSVVEAASLEGALALAKRCPALQFGGGVQVGALADLPPDHAASRLRERIAQR